MVVWYEMDAQKRRLVEKICKQNLRKLFAIIKKRSCLQLTVEKAVYNMRRMFYKWIPPLYLVEDMQRITGAVQ